jgi:hypothetical protein
LLQVTNPSGPATLTVVPSDEASEELARRLVRMKQLIDDLERVCSENNLQSEILESLRRDMDAARRSLKSLAQ